MWPATTVMALITARVRSARSRHRGRCGDAECKCFAHFADVCEPDGWVYQRGANRYAFKHRRCGAGARALQELARTFAPHARWAHADVPSLLSMDGPAWLALSEGTPLKRATSDGLARNAAIVLGNHGDPVALPALREAATGHDQPIVREAAAWAIDRIERQAR